LKGDIDMAEELSKATKTAKQTRKLSATELNDVSGGAWMPEDGSGYSCGNYIYCPSCGAESHHALWRYMVDDSYGIDRFRCRNCGFEWGVDGDGWLYDLESPLGPQLVWD
jgi:hypothetical protein